MKSLTSLASLLALLALAAGVPLALAQTPPPPPAQSADHPLVQRLREQRMAAIDTAVGLTAAEKASINAIWDGHEQQIYAVMEDMSLDRMTLRRKIRAIMKDSHAEVRAVLTPDQQARFDAMPVPARLSRL
jgi:Spy/CpxP family protein refolding chaperone